jgi:hypothetical protein
MVERRKREWITLAEVGGAETTYPYTVDFWIYVPHSDIQVGVSIGPEPGAGGAYAHNELCEVYAQRQNRSGQFITVAGDDTGSGALGPIVSLEVMGDAYDLGGTVAADRYLGHAIFHQAYNYGGAGAQVLVAATWDFPSTMCDADIDRLWGRCSLAGPPTPLRLKEGG